MPPSPRYEAGVPAATTIVSGPRAGWTCCRAIPDSPPAAAPQVPTPFSRQTPTVPVPTLDRGVRMTRTDEPDPRGGLVQLVETEDRLEAMLTVRREEAARLVEETRARVTLRLRSLDDEIATRSADLEREIEDRAAAAAREVAVEGDRRAARWRDVPESRLDELAAVVLDRLLDAVEEGE